MSMGFEHKWVSRITLKKIFLSLSHLLGVSLLFILPEMVISVISNEGPGPLATVVYGKAFVFVAVFYINFYLIVPFCMQRSHTKLRFTAYNILVVILAMGMIALLWQWGHAEAPHQSQTPWQHTRQMMSPPPPRTGSHINTPYTRIDWVMIWRDSLVLVLTIALAVALKLTGKWQDSERMRHEAQSIQQQNEISRLKAQLNPHFLFNTLNTIYALIDISPEKARDAVHVLSKMLRYALYECHGTVTLDEELQFVESYLSIVKLRLPSPECAQVTTSAGDCGSMQMAPLLFINIIENCVKHCHLASPSDRISINISATDGLVTCVCSNPYLRTAPQNANGLGLKNLRRRLEILYGSGAQMTVVKSDSLFTVTLQVNISTPPLYSDLASYANIATPSNQLKQ